MGLLDSNKVLTRSVNEIVTTTKNFTNSTNLYIENPNRYKTAIIKISIDKYVDDFIWDCVLEGTNFVTSRGNVIQRITKNGVYYIDTCRQESLRLRFEEGLSDVGEKIATIEYVLCDDSINKTSNGNALLSSKKVTLSAGSAGKIFEGYINLGKYLYYTIYAKDSDGNKVIPKCDVLKLFGDRSYGISDFIWGESVTEKIESESVGYRSEWEEIRYDRLQFELQNTDEREVTYYVNIYTV